MCDPNPVILNLSAQRARTHRSRRRAIGGASPRPVLFREGGHQVGSPPAGRGGGVAGPLRKCPRAFGVRCSPRGVTCGGGLSATGRSWIGASDPTGLPTAEPTSGAASHRPKKQRRKNIHNEACFRLGEFTVNTPTTQLPQYYTAQTFSQTDSNRQKQFSVTRAPSPLVLLTELGIRGEMKKSPMFHDFFNGCL